LIQQSVIAEALRANAERENSMRPFMRSAKCSLAAAVAALGAIFLTGARAAESFQIEGGQIADAAPDATGIRVFKGIPYAAPPVGELRWKAPQPVQPWNGLRSVAEWGPRCVQSDRLGDLDPLFVVRILKIDHHQIPPDLLRQPQAIHL
jgi:Carboxylesterase family